MKIKNKLAFTLVELIVVVTILSILSTIGFVSYSGYLAGVRDTNRVSQLKAIGDALHLYTTKSSLPRPDDKVDVTTGTSPETIVAYQGYIGKDVIETIGYTSEGKDPKDDTYFSYYLTKDRKYFQLMAFLEEDPELAYKPHPNPLLLGEGIVQAIDYTTRYPHVEGSKLGILTNEDNIPIQEIESIKTATKLNISTTTDTYKSYLKTDKVLKGDYKKLKFLGNTSVNGGKNWEKILFSPFADGSKSGVWCDDWFGDICYKVNAALGSRTELLQYSATGNNTGLEFCKIFGYTGYTKETFETYKKHTGITFARGAFLNTSHSNLLNVYKEIHCSK